MTTNIAPNDYLFGLFGAGGLGRGVMPFCKASLNSTGFENFRLAFVEKEPALSSINGHPVLSEQLFFTSHENKLLFNIAISDSVIRKRLANKCIDKGASPISIISPNALVYENNLIGAGAIICGFCSITSNVIVGDFFHCNIYSYVEHDCVIGDYVTFAPNVHCNGNVHIQDFAYIGAGAIIKQGSKDKPLTIGEGAVVGMGAVVTKDVPPFTTVVGNPARPLI